MNRGAPSWMKILATNHTNFLVTDHSPLTTIFDGVSYERCS